DSKNKNFCSKDGVMYTTGYRELLYCPQTKTSVTIPNGVEYIGFKSFEDGQITSVTLPESVTAICGNAFRGCPNIKTINIPSKVDFVGLDAFEDCKNLESITVDSKNKYFSSASGVLYNKDKTTLVECPTKKKSLTIPNTVETIRIDACRFCTIESLTMPDSVTSIEKEAFVNCAALKSVKLSKNITNVGECAFMSCESLAKVSITGGVVGPAMFMNCGNLSSVDIAYGVSQIDSSAFYKCQKLKSVTIPSSVKTIGEQAFGYYSYYDAQNKLRKGKVSGFTIYGVKGSAAQKYATANGFKFVAVTDSIRLAGKNRYDTAAVIAQNMLNRSSAVILASGEGYADALAGVPLAKYLGAPILLTPKNSLSSETLTEIKRRKATKVIILGGYGAVSKNVESALQKQGLKTVRLAGDTRYGTAVEIANNMDYKPTEVFFACAGGFADALSAGAAAALKSAPIIYLSKDGELNAESKAYLEQLKKKGCVKKAYVIGGTGVISDEMMNKAASALGLKSGSTMKRIAGANRYETCLEVNKQFASLFTGKMICVSTGKTFPDALAGGVYAAEKKAFMLLADSAVSEKQKTFLAKHKGSTMAAFGGEGAVSSSLFSSICKAAMI
ncbi:MAG: leucine-rich repeat protein, partial [Ruminococcus sp.]|nr:leucine-rich repeat protein [Ruminococcus sp.]